MSSPKRSCSSCTFFHDAPLQGYGWCTHPKRQLTTEVRILVRKGELACRNPWGKDQWESKSPDSGIGTNAVQPAPDRLVASTGAASEDRVTSVTTSLSLQSPTADPARVQGHVFAQRAVNDDVIVSQPLMLPEAGPPDCAEPVAAVGGDREERDGLNLPAHEDQQERVRVIARGNRDAILKARERMILRRGGADRATVTAPAGDELSGDRAVSPNSGDDSRDDAPDADRFADDSLLPVAHRFARRSQGVHSGLGIRARGYADPTPPVPADEVNGRLWQSPQVTRSSDAARFESVPEIKPDLALPQLRTFLKVNGSSSDTHGQTDGRDATGQVETSYDRVLQRAQAIKTASQKQRDSRMIRNRSNTQLQTSRLVASGAAGSIATHERTAPGARPMIGQRRHETDELRESETPRFDQEDEWAADLDEAGTLEVETLDTRFEEDPFPDDDAYPLYDDEDEAASAPRAEPQHSWWRGLSIGFRRRAEQEPLEMDNLGEFGDADPEDWFDDEDVADGEEPGGSRGHERVFSFASEEGIRVRPSISLEDSRAAEEELIDYELTDEVLETSFADDTDRVQSEAWREEQQDISAPPDRAPARSDHRSRSTSAFALSDPRAMDAFREALFGTVSDGLDSPNNSHLERSQPRKAPEPSPVPREDIPATRLERPAHDDRPVRTQQRYAEEAAFDIRDFVEQDEELLDMRVQIAPDVPRACQTCRNFRPSDSGERGWCTNDFAFTHRQMVNAEDLPCQSSIGCWWLPSDETWMPEEDLAFRDLPTPLTDRLIARRHGRDAGEDHREPVLYVREM